MTRRGGRGAGPARPATFWAAASMVLLGLGPGGCSAPPRQPDEAGAQGAPKLRVGPPLPGAEDAEPARKVLFRVRDLRPGEPPTRLSHYTCFLFGRNGVESWRIIGHDASDPSKPLATVVVSRWMSAEAVDELLELVPGEAIMCIAIIGD